MWVDRQGTEQPLTVPSAPDYVSPRISPDGGHIAFGVIELISNVDSQVWVHDVARGTTTRVTFERANVNPVWTQDGKRLIYMSAPGFVGSGAGTLAAVAADGSGPPVTLMGEGVNPAPTSVSPDGKLVIGVRSSGICAQRQRNLGAAAGRHEGSRGQAPALPRHPVYARQFAVLAGWQMGGIRIQ